MAGPRRRARRSCPLAVLGATLLAAPAAAETRVVVEDFSTKAGLYIDVFGGD
jgi:hypothetical protein